MTPVGKFSIATLILGSALLTAKYLHPNSAEPDLPPTAANPRRQLSWQARSTVSLPTPALAQVGPPANPKPAEAASDRPKPLGVDAQVRFTAFANTSTAPADATQPAPAGGAPALPTLGASGRNSARAASGQVAPPVSAPQSPTATSVLQSPSVRPPIPLAVTPRSELSQVQRHELTQTQATADVVEHTVQFGETLPILAAKYLGDREAYLAIYAANLDVLESPTDVAPGLVLKIPVHR